jgi:SNF2 family DNA or RNA helicase
MPPCFFRMVKLYSRSHKTTGVISLDLGWSPAIEAQAFDRVHRLGQKRDVHVQRLVIENTVEDRILQLQERKVRVLGHDSLDFHC